MSDKSIVNIVQDRMDRAFAGEDIGPGSGATYGDFFDDVSDGPAGGEVLEVFLDHSGQISFWVAGIPQPAGSKRAFYNPKLGRALITEDNKKSAPWRAVVSEAAAQAVTAMMEGPIRVRFEFVLPRPKGHYGSGKNTAVLKRGAPAFPAVKPDCTKLLRGAEDAVKGILWRDDSQIVSQYASKRYGPQAGVQITVSPEKA